MVQEHDDMKERSERWTFLTNHGHALICIARDPTVRLRDVASQLGVTERTAQAIVNDLADGGYVLRSRVGNRSQYVVRASLPLRHQVERDHAVGELIDLMAPARAAHLAPQRSPRHDT